MTDTPPTDQDMEIVFIAIDVLREHAPAHVAKKFSDAVEACMSGEGSLDECLGISAYKQGSRHAARIYCRNQRNYYLCEAHKCCTAEKPWWRSIELAGHIKEFNEKWQFMQSMDSPDDSWSQLRTNLFLAFKWGSKYENGLPLINENRIHEIYTTMKNKSYRGGYSSV